jgi:phosphomannomutase
MNPAKPLILFGVLAALPAAAMAQSTPVDTSKWQCKLCKFEQGASGSIEVGAGYVSDKSAKFGDYTGLNEEGGYFIGAASSRYRGADGTYWDVRA